MKTVSQVMSRTVEAIHPDATLQRAAQRMGDLRTELLPVCDGGRLIGVITDRDIAIRAVACGLNPAASLVGDVMTSRAIWCHENQEVEEVLQTMDEEHVSRLPVLGAGQQIVGIVSRSQLDVPTPLSRLAFPRVVITPIGDSGEAGNGRRADCGPNGMFEARRQ